ncbi:unnamed protein product [marine sediment metagenome]|uniref:Uncharacterized protein n=1 Tax=marine sediment metagenome TaxID=412755 RepID=X1L575_9ZZZZ
MVARGQHINTGIKQFHGCIWSYTYTAGNILGIGNDQVKPVLLPQVGQKLVYGSPAGLTNYVTNH